jgi:hypothetical protein
MVLGLCPEWYSATCPLRKNERAVPLRTRHPCTLSGPGLETDCNVDWHHTRLQTTTRQEFFCLQVVCNKTERNGGWQGHAATEFFLQKLFKMDKMSFFMSCVKLEIFGRCLCMKRYLFSGKFYREFDVKVGKVNFDLARYTQSESYANFPSHIM